MNVTTRGIARAADAISHDRAAAYIASRQFDRPTLVLDPMRVAAQYDALAEGLSGARIHYAVKANPQPEIIGTLVARGSRFDAASRAEIELCLSQGAEACDISFGNTIKKVSDIAFAYGVGIDLFAADAEEELLKLAEHAPGARVYIRVIVEHSQADWPLSRKFGCSAAKVVPLMDMAVDWVCAPWAFRSTSAARPAALPSGTLFWMKWPKSGPWRKRPVTT